MPSSYHSNNYTGEEKKLLAPMLAKLHISPASTPSLLKEVYNEVSIAIDDKLIADATGRNALFKIHVSLGKIANSLKDNADGTVSLKSSVNSRKESIAPSVVDEEKTVLSADGTEVDVGDKTELVKVEEEVQEEDEGTIIGRRDSLMSELLSDADVEMSGM